MLRPRNSQRCAVLGLVLPNMSHFKYLPLMPQRCNLGPSLQSDTTCYLVYVFCWFDICETT